MGEKKKDQDAILNKLGIAALNPMQKDAHEAIKKHAEIVLLSPTGSGKTLAFLLPLISELDHQSKQVQLLIVVPSRELAIQIEQVIRNMGSGFKANAVYGGRAGSKDKIEISHPPAILVGTPGRIADHFRKKSIHTESIKALVLDEFDKSLEIGFEKEMLEILEALPNLRKKILTSATRKTEIPAFVGMKKPEYLNYLESASGDLIIKTIISPTQDKLETLKKLLGFVKDGNGIIFCNLKSTIEGVGSFLDKLNIRYGCFHGGLEQIDRERALIKFRNGTVRILLATDLAARGIDVPDMDFIIHFDIPPKPDEFIHRNGRTARMQKNGTAYVIKWKNEKLPDFIDRSETLILENYQAAASEKWETLYISGGRKDKISKGDIAGLFFKQGNLTKDELGNIELKHDCAYVAVPASKAEILVQSLSNCRLKNKKVRISRMV